PYTTLFRSQEYNITIVIITHQMSIIQKVCNRIAVMVNGKIIEQGNVLDVFGSPQQVSTQEFVRTIIHDQVPDTIKNKMQHIPGSRIYTIAFDQNATSTIVNHLMRNFDITVNIIFASMNEIQDDTVGYIVLQLIGEETALEDAANYLKKQPILAKEMMQ